uniref:Uncharacterized protein n=1 Tax=Anopheles merus TaxID=30066 RepID=A0A182UZV8_ANOME
MIILHVRNHHLHIGRERFVVRWTAPNTATTTNRHRPLERSLSIRIIRTGRGVWATRMMVVLLVVMVMLMLMVLLLPSVPPPLPCLPAAGTPFEAERDSFAGWVILFRRLPPGSCCWCSAWLDEPCRLSECRFEAEPDWCRLRLVVLERFRSAKLLRFPPFGLARLVVLDRIKHSVLSVPPPPPPPPNARNAVVLLCTLDRRCRSRAPPARLDVLPRTEPASRSGWVALFASACWQLGSRVVPLALRLIRNVAVLIDGTGLGAGGSGSSTAGCPSPPSSPSNVTFSYVCDSPSPSSGAPPGGPCRGLSVS